MDAMRAHADAILDLVGDVSEGKTPVVETSNIYGGMNSASVLEPMVRLYHLSGEERYLAFARHIISSGGSNIANIFRLAHEDKTPPYLYGVNKAYEMMSCFEGLIEYYEVTGDAFCRDAAIRFAHQVINSDVTVIGCCGTESELFDHSAVRQTRNVKGPLQETCVSVTWMKLCRRLLLITGDTAFLDEIERTYYNAFLGALNTEDKRSADLVNDGQGTRRFLAFDSYSPLTVGHRGILTGGAQPLEDGTAYGCCAAIGAAGSAVFPKSAVLVEDGGVFIGLYEEGSVKVTLSDGTNLKIVTETAYPSDGKIRITLLPDRQSEFKLSIRVPAWSRQTRLTVCGEQVNVDKTGKCCLKRLWNSGDILELTLDMRVYLLRAPHYDSDIFYRIDWSNGKMLPTRICQAEQDRNHACFMRGPLVLAASARLGWSSERSQVITEANGSEIDSTDAERSEVPYPCMVACRVKPLQGDELLMTDYASAGKQWCKEDRFAAWIPARFQS